MKIVIDTNILMSALIKSSVTRRIILDSYFDFYYPEISMNELRKHENLILAKSKLRKKEYDELLENLLERVILIPTKFFSESLEEANNEMKLIDPDDVVFLACAISLNADIWSNDGDFQKQKKVKVFTTEEFMKLFFKNNSM
jgi:predicted nucleic acid-binding protein